MLFFRDRPKNAMPDAQDKEHWDALLRGQIITSAVYKLVNFINLADQKAQAMIILNSILIPIVLNWMKVEDYHISVTLSVITAFISMFMAILCIYPKRRDGRKPDGSKNYLHFGDIAQMKEEMYLFEFQPIFNDLSLLTEEAIKDMHDVSRRVLKSKYFWLKLSYGCFFIGNLLAVLIAIYTYWTIG